MLLHGLLHFLVVLLHYFLNLLSRHNHVPEPRNPHIPLILTRRVQLKLPQGCFYEEGVDVLAATCQLLESGFSGRLWLVDRKNLPKENIFYFFVVLALAAVVVGVGVLHWPNLENGRDEIQREVPLRVGGPLKYLGLLGSFSHFALHEEVTERAVSQTLVVPLPKGNVGFLDFLIIFRIQTKLLM